MWGPMVPGWGGAPEQPQGPVYPQRDPNDPYEIARERLRQVLQEPEPDIRSPRFNFGQVLLTALDPTGEAAKKLYEKKAYEAEAPLRAREAKIKGLRGIVDIAPNRTLYNTQRGLYDPSRGGMVPGTEPPPETESYQAFGPEQGIFGKSSGSIIRNPQFGPEATKNRYLPSGGGVFDTQQGKWAPGAAPRPPEQQRNRLYSVGGGVFDADQRKWVVAPEDSRVAAAAQKVWVTAYQGFISNWQKTMGLGRAPTPDIMQKARDAADAQREDFMKTFAEPEDDGTGQPQGAQGTQGPQSSGVNGSSGDPFEDRVTELMMSGMTVQQAIEKATAEGHK